MPLTWSLEMLMVSMLEEDTHQMEIFFGYVMRLIYHRLDKIQYFPAWFFSRLSPDSKGLSRREVGQEPRVYQGYHPVFHVLPRKRLHVALSPIRSHGDP